MKGSANGEEKGKYLQCDIVNVKLLEDSFKPCEFMLKFV